MWGWEIKICTQILYRGTGHVISRMRSDDLHWSGTLEIGAEYLENGWRYTLGHNGAYIGNGYRGIHWSHDR